MKALVAACLCSLLASVALTSMSAQEVEPAVFDVHTLDGKVYLQSRVIKVTPADITFMHEGGVAKVAFENLSVDWREKYQFDADKAEEYREIQLSMQRDAEEELKKQNARREEAEKKAMAELQEKQKRKAKAAEVAAAPAAELAPLPGESVPKPVQEELVPKPVQEELVPALTPIGPVHETEVTRGRVRSSAWRYGDGIYSVEGYVPPYIWGYGQGYRHVPRTWHEPYGGHHHHRGHHHHHHHSGSGVFIGPPMIRITR